MNDKKTKKYLKELTQSVSRAISCLDSIMKGPSTNERGKQVAKICNFLDISNDAAMHFGLGYDFKKIENIKRYVINNIGGLNGRI